MRKKKEGFDMKKKAKISKAKILFYKIRALFRNSFLTRIWKWKHKSFICILCVLVAILVFVYFCFNLNDEVETIIISVATGLFASMIIAWYSEIKTYELSDLEELMIDIEQFNREIHRRLNQIDKCASSQQAVELYDDLTQKQESVLEKYEKNEKHLRKPIPALGYQVDPNDKEFHDFLSKARAGKMEDSKEKEEVLLTIQDIMWVMLRQNNYCMENVHETLKYARKVF